MGSLSPAPVWLGLATVLFVTTLAVGADGSFRNPRIGIPVRRHLAAGGTQSLVSRCEKRVRNATLDHFTLGPRATFGQRYYVCMRENWAPANASAATQAGPLFIYLGNEADVTLYLEHTGLMWESAPEFGAMLVFAEHRYYGESSPYPWPFTNVTQQAKYLTAEQALADFADLITDLKREFNFPAVIGFGGSYGGWLVTWFRMKYPHLMDGGIAGSAPIMSFLGMTPPVDPNFFAKGTTYDASAKGGSHPKCVSNSQAAFKALKQLGTTAAGRRTAESYMSLCPGLLNSTDDVQAVMDWAQGAWQNMAMGNYPYSSSYILQGQGELPGFPVRVACSYLGPANATSDAELLKGMAAAIGVYYNYTKTVKCFNNTAPLNEESDKTGYLWNLQYCTEFLQPFGSDGVSDMFYKSPFNLTATLEFCAATYNLTSMPRHAITEWGGRNVSTLTNLVFSNGMFDPWARAGVLQDISPSAVALMIPQAAHHLDLMFSTPEDPPALTEARRQERAYMHAWVAEAQARNRRQFSTGPQCDPWGVCTGMPKPGAQ